MVFRKSAKLLSRQYPFHRQTDQSDCGPSCLKMIAEYYGQTLDINDLRNKCKRTKGGVTFQALSDAAEEIGFKSLGVSVDFKTLEQDVPLPCIVQWRKRHLITIFKITKRHIIVSDPLFGVIKYSHEDFSKNWIYSKKENEKEGAVLLLEPLPEFFKKNYINRKPTKGFSFLVKYFKPYTKYSRQILISLFLGSII